MRNRRIWQAFRPWGTVSIDGSTNGDYYTVHISRPVATDSESDAIESAHNFVDILDKHFDEYGRPRGDESMGHERKIPHMNAKQEQVILRALSEFDRSNGEVVNLTGETFSQQYCGIMEFEISTSIGPMKICVFNDCDEWDYIDQITVNGTTYQFPTEGDMGSLPCMTLKVAYWRPAFTSERWGDLQPDFWGGIFGDYED